MCVVLNKQLCIPNLFMDKTGVSGAREQLCIPKPSMDKTGVSGARECIPKLFFWTKLVCLVLGSSVCILKLSFWPKLVCVCVSSPVPKGSFSRVSSRGQ